MQDSPNPKALKKGQIRALTITRPNPRSYGEGDPRIAPMLIRHQEIMPSSPFAMMLRETGSFTFDGTVVSSERKPGEYYAKLRIASPYLNAAAQTSGQEVTLPVDAQTDDLIPKYAPVRITVEVLI